MTNRQQGEFEEMNVVLARYSLDVALDTADTVGAGLARLGYEAFDHASTLMEVLALAFHCVDRETCREIPQERNTFMQGLLDYFTGQLDTRLGRSEWGRQPDRTESFIVSRWNELLTTRHEEYSRHVSLMPTEPANVLQPGSSVFADACYNVVERTAEPDAANLMLVHTFLQKAPLLAKGIGLSLRRGELSITGARRAIVWTESHYNEVLDRLTPENR